MILTITSLIRTFLSTEEIKQIEKTFFKLSNWANFSNNVSILTCDSLEELAQKTKVPSLPAWVIATNQGTCVFLLKPTHWPKKKEYSVTQICIHELTHVIINNAIQNCPLWLNEGLACFYANQISTIINNNTLTINPYNATYDNGLYSISGKTIWLLMKKYGEAFILNRIKSSSNIRTDDILGYNALNNLIK
ncbi:MAG: hypothetical protein LBJ83_01120 [Oscillospiraceae bacterium]|nr:hypothetical protein [Oscillospiraceae bacterium]